MTKRSTLDTTTPRGLHRRGFLRSMAAFAGASLAELGTGRGLLARPKFSSDPFTLGVTSGDPSPDGFILWTRLAPDPVNGGGLPGENYEVEWTVARDEKMRDVVRRGSVAARPEFAHTVHAEVSGLEPDRWYWYEFRSGGEVSAAGRARTTPAPGEALDRFRFAFASCQHYEHGYYTAFSDMAAGNPDLIVHLGDYIYEGAAEEGHVRRHNSGEIHTLADYRNRYALYKTDPELQAAHAAAPWLVVWDDHEFDNNYANDVSEEQGVNREAFLARRAAAYQAYYEHMPLRPRSLPEGPRMRLYRRIRFGPLAEFFLLDTRQFRTDQPCGDGEKAPCEGVFDPEATILGREQEAWLMESLQRSEARWNVLAQQVLVANPGQTPEDEKVFFMDKWGAYHFASQRLLNGLDEMGVSNPVVITGDIHSNWVNDLKLDFEDPDSKTVGAEFACTSISSGGDGVTTHPKIERLLSENFFVKFLNARRGYVRCEVTPKQWRSDFREVEAVTKPDQPVRTSASFVVEDGRPGAVRL